MVVNEPTYNNSPPWFNNKTLTKKVTKIVVAVEIGVNHPSAEWSSNNGKTCYLEEPLWSYQKDCGQLKSSSSKLLSMASYGG